jgi:uncharacterized membrane protein
MVRIECRVKSFRGPIHILPRSLLASIPFRLHVDPSSLLLLSIIILFPPGHILNCLPTGFFQDTTGRGRVVFHSFYATIFGLPLTGLRPMN